MAWKVQIFSEAKEDIQEAITWYNHRQKGLGKRYHKELKLTLARLKKNPHYAIKYQQVRCLKVHKFPYLVHFVLDESSHLIIIPGILNTSLEPNANWFTDMD